ncbi:aldehyde dehydrogenase, partial [Curtobacterium sp. MCSS17_008]
MSNHSDERYTGFDRLAIGGEWRRGSSDRTAEDIDPWTGASLVEIQLASQDDVDAAYEAA